jgi:PAS domain S-box-containing protein
MFSKTNRYVLLPRLCGFLSVALALSVLFGWYTQNQALIQVFPHFAPMQYNTALGILIVGLGVCARSYNYAILSTLLGLSSALLGGVTLTQYMFGIDFGIDEFLMDAYITVKTTHPGRMAPNTALCFTLMGLVLSVGQANRIFQISLASSVIVLSVLAFLGYLTNVEGLYGWGNLTRMAVHTASAFVILGIGSLSLGMTRQKKAYQDLWQAMPATLFGTLLILSFLFSFGIREATQVRNTEYFERLVADTQDALLDRFQLYEQSLLGGVGVFHASESVERHEWQAYVDSLNIDKTLPGIAGLGFIDLVAADKQEAYLEQVREDGAPNFKAYPETNFDDKFIIRFIEPEDFNAKAIGLDIGFEANRREAAEIARNDGIPKLTRKIILVQDGQQTPGFLFLLPVYESNATPATLNDRLSGFRGWVYAPFIASDFLKGLVDGNRRQVRFDIYDGQSTSPEALIYKSSLKTANLKPFEKQTVIVLGERDWTINWSSTENFSPPAMRNLPFLVFLLGSVASMLIYLTLLRLLRSKEIIAHQVERQTFQLAESEKRLQLVLDNAGEGILGLNIYGYITFANKAARALLGYSFDELTAAPLDTLVNKKSPQELLLPGTETSGFVQSFLHGVRFTDDNQVFWTKANKPISVEYTSDPIHDEAGDVTGAVIVFRDIAERKAAEAEIKQANAELEEFAYRTSHDLRSPLVSSIGLLSIAERAIKAENKDKALATLSLSQTSLEKLENLVKDILLLTQTKNEVEIEEYVAVDELIQEAIDKLRHLDDFKRLDIRKDLKFVDSLNVKKNRLILIVENLISNAVKYQDREKAQSWMKISTEEVGGYFILSVEDNGLGIPKEQQKNLFKMFKRFHPKTSFGSGLGLYMMNKSVMVLGGEINFKDTGEGSIFSLAIPISFPSSPT